MTRRPPARLDPVNRAVNRLTHRDDTWAPIIDWPHIAAGAGIALTSLAIVALYALAGWANT